MPILIMGLVALVLFVGLLFLLIAAMTAEHRQRQSEVGQGSTPEPPKAPKVEAHSAGR